MSSTKGTPAYLQIDWLERRVATLEAENAELRNDAEIGSAIRMAAKDLPENFELEITVERGAASVYLRTPDEETVCIDVDSDNRLAAEIRNGIDRARSANERI